MTMPSYFDFYELKEAFHVDLNLVKKKFYELSKAYHPDFYVQKTFGEQQDALALATFNNKAYEVLSDPQKRIAYILERHGLLNAIEKYELPKGFLMEMLELNENLTALMDSFNEEKFNAIKKEIESLASNLDEELEHQTQAFDTSNAADQKGILLAIKDVWMRKKYLLRIQKSLNRFVPRI